MDLAPKIELLNYASDLMFKPTSKKQLMFMLDDKVKVIAYEELNDYKTLDDLLGEYKATIMLYPITSDLDNGHWCCIFQRPGTDEIEFFDSYGLFMDETVDFYNTEGRYMKNETAPRERAASATPFEPKVLELILNSPHAEKMFYNDTAFQNLQLRTATCGLWVVIRLKNSHLSENAFKARYYTQPLNKNIEPDLLVSAQIHKLYPEI